MSKNNKAVRKERKQFIKKSIHYLTSFEKISYKILSMMYLSIYWLLIPFIVLIFLVDGFQFSVLTVLGIAFLVFVPIMRQNEKRLETLIKSRMELEKQPVLEKQNELNSGIKPNKIAESKASYVFPAISLNMGTNSFLVTGVSIFITFLFVWSHGWGHNITNFFLYLSIALLIFSFWFPYSNIIKRQVEFHEEFLVVGKRTLYYREFRKVLCRNNGRILEFHLTYTDEPMNIRPENEVQQEAKDQLNKWCERLEIPFTEI